MSDLGKEQGGGKKSPIGLLRHHVEELPLKAGISIFFPRAKVNNPEDAGCR